MTARLTLIVMTSIVITSIVGGCEREEREFRPPASETHAPARVSSADGLHYGRPPAPTHNRYEESAYAIVEGRRLYSWFNCEGCHFLGGGGIGPALMDEEWIYGGEPANVFATIVGGRPNGMPAFGNRIPEYQVWQIVAYVRSMSGQVSKGVSPGRPDHMSGKPAEQSMPRQSPLRVGSEQ